MGRLTEDEYAAMAADYEVSPPTESEIAGPVHVDPSALRKGRPPKDAPRRGRTPTMSVRLPEELRERLAVRADAEAVTPGEVIRRAIVEYLERHHGAA